MKRNIIVIGASAGGVEAIPRVLAEVERGISASIFVSLHVSAQAPSIFPDLISRHTGFPAQHPRDGIQYLSGRVYVAPPDHHLVIEHGRVRLSHGPKENRHRPSIDVMFRSAAEAHGTRVAGALLTGNLDDGVSGLQCIQERGGLTVVQDPEEAPFPEMPARALAAFEPDFCLGLKEIGALLTSAVLGKKELAMKKQRKRGNGSDANGNAAGSRKQQGGGELVPFVCPECHGPLWETQKGKQMNYKCMVGHRYSAESLLAGHAEELEAALWIAVRTLEERAGIQSRLISKLRDEIDSASVKFFKQRRAEHMMHAELIRSVLEKLKR